MTNVSEDNEAHNKKPITDNSDEQLFVKHLHDIHRIFVQFLNPRLKKFYDGLNDYFFDLAEAAVNNQQQNQYFAAIGDTRKNNTELNRQFTKNINIIFQSLKIEIMFILLKVRNRPSTIKKPSRWSKKMI